MMKMLDLWGGMDLKETFILKAFNFQKVNSNITFHDIVSSTWDYYALSAWDSLKLTVVENNRKNRVKERMRNKNKWSNEWIVGL